MKLPPERNRGSALLIGVACIVFLALLVMAYSRIMVSRQMGTAVTLGSPRAFYVAQAGVEYAIRFGLDNPSSWGDRFSGVGERRGFGGGEFWVQYTDAGGLDRLNSRGLFTSAERSVALDNFTSYICLCGDDFSPFFAYEVADELYGLWTAGKGTYPLASNPAMSLVVTVKKGVTTRVVTGIPGGDYDSLNELKNCLKAFFEPEENENGSWAGTIYISGSPYDIDDLAEGDWLTGYFTLTMNGTGGKTVTLGDPVTDKAAISMNARAGKNDFSVSGIQYVARSP